MPDIKVEVLESNLIDLLASEEDQVARNQSKDNATQKVPTEEGMTKEALNKYFTWQYDYSDATKKNISQSVSELKRQEMDESDYIGPVVDEPTMVPKFMNEGVGLTGAMKGTIYHKVMDQLDFAKCLTLEAIKNQIDHMVDTKVLTQDEVKTVYLKSILSFVESNLGQRILSAHKKNL